MQQFTIGYRESTISYLKGGNGTDVLLCLHGYGESAGSFSFLEQHLEDEFTIYAIDLPFHGHTKWQEGFTLEPDALLEIISSIIPGFQNRQVTLLCYSMGGRIGLHFYQQNPDRFRKLVLLAPDGLKINFWYWLATQTSPGNALFRFTMTHPGWFTKMTDWLRSRKLINTSIAKFVHAYVDDEKVRTDLYRIWTTMRKFRPQLSRIKKLLHQHKTELVQVFGEYDRIILPENSKKLTQPDEAFVKTVVLKAGHQLLKEKQAPAIVSLLRS